VQEQAQRRRVDAARRCRAARARHPRGAHVAHGLVDDVLARPAALDASRVEEALEHREPLGRVAHLGVELQRVDPSLAVLHGRHRRVGRLGRDREPARHARDAVAVAHPGHELALDAAEQVAFGAREDRLAVLAHRRRRDLTTERPGDELHAVADREDREAAVEQPVRQRGCTVRVDALRTARQHDGSCVVLAQALGVTCGGSITE
jgi:hypothetical protein